MVMSSLNMEKNSFYQMNSANIYLELREKGLQEDPIVWIRT